jgi:signal transduction histidine kinase
MSFDVTGPYDRIVTVALATRPSVRRRDRLIDVAVVVGAFAGGLGVLAIVVAETDPPRDEVATQLVVGAFAALALWWRRRRPVLVAGIMVPLSFLSAIVQVTGLFAVFSVAARRSWRTAVVMAVLFWLPTTVLYAIEPDPDLSWLGAVAFSGVLAAAAMGWGMFVGAQRQLVASWRERAAAAEQARQRQVADARREERLRIAREMHDVLGHRLTLLGLHAGALEFRPDLPPATLADAAGTVREQSRLALADLRQVVGVLRDEAGEPSGPQPGLADLGALIEESRRGGMNIRDRLSVDGADVPAGVACSTYRIVQEALTNARKHAPGLPVDVRVAATSGHGVMISVANERPTTGSGPPDQGWSSGLLGLAERARLVGGWLTHGGGDGRYELRAWLPASTT